jgi:RNA recognition motif-containing protein
MSSSDCVLHVTGLPTGVDEDRVKAAFESFGGVTSVKVLPPRSDKTDAAAIVEMPTAEQAKLAIENLNGKVPDGFAEPLVVTKKLTKSNKGWGKGGGYGGMDPWTLQMMYYYQYSKGWGKGKGKGFSRGGLSSFPAEKKVWVDGIEEGITFKELQEHFPGSKFATVMKGKAAGTGGVAFATAEEATAAIQTLNGSTLSGKTLVVDVWTKKEAGAEETVTTSV